MKITTKTGKCALLLVLAGCLLSAGCVIDGKPSPVRTGFKGGLKVIDTLAVSPGDEAEVAAVTAAEVARVQYRYRLTVLRGYCNSIGDADRYNWSGKELENLDEAQWFTWTGIPEVLPPEGESLTDADPSFDITEEGDYTLTVSATDLAGNVRVETIAFCLDLTDPVIAFDTPRDHAELRDETVLVRGTFAERFLSQVVVDPGNHHASFTGDTWVLGSFPLVEGTNAFFEKRDPDYRGR